MWEWQILTIQQTACPASVKPFTAMPMFTSNRFYPSVTTHACWRQFKPINTMPHTGRSLAYPLFHRCWSPPLLARTGLRAGSNQHETVRKEISWLFSLYLFLKLATKQRLSRFKCTTVPGFRFENRQPVRVLRNVMEVNKSVSAVLPPTESHKNHLHDEILIGKWQA